MRRRHRQVGPRRFLRLGAIASIAICIGLLYVATTRFAVTREPADAGASNATADDSASEESWYQAERGKALQGDLMAMVAIADLYAGNGKWHHDEMLACAWLTLVVNAKGASVKPNDTRHRNDACNKLEPPRRAVAAQRAAELGKIVAVAGR